MHIYISIFIHNIYIYTIIFVELRESNIYTHTYINIYTVVYTQEEREGGSLILSMRFSHRERSANDKCTN